MKNKIPHIILPVYANICRFMLAVVFIFSGFVKANDPQGFQYKLAEYATALGLSAWTSDFVYSVFGMLLITVEFIIGVYLLFGINRRLTLWIALLLMLVMTPLTLYLAIENPVSDCGCFGDAVVLTNWQTFWKNVLLLVAVVSALYWRQYIFRIVTRRSEWLISLNSLVYILAFAYYTQAHLPVFDFRPYSVGTHIPSAMSQPEGTRPPVYETLFLMEKGGEQREFTVDNYPDDSWHYVSRRTVLKEEGVLPDIPELEIWDTNAGEDISEQIWTREGYSFLMVAYDLRRADDSYTDLINDVYDYCCRYGYGFYAITATDDLVEQWQDRTGGEYPFYRVDETVLKTMVRSNPGLLLLKEGTVINKWSYRDIPEEYQLTRPLDELPVGEIQVGGIVRKIGFPVLWFVFPLVIISVADKLYARWKNRCSDRMGGTPPSFVEESASV